MDKTEYKFVTFIDCYFKGFHAGITVRGDTLPTEQEFTFQAAAVSKTVENLISLGYEPSWNKETSKSYIQPVDPIQTVTAGVPSKVNPQTASTVPICKVHNKQMVYHATGKWGPWWSCTDKDEFGNWCKEKLSVKSTNK